MRKVTGWVERGAGWLVALETLVTHTAVVVAQSPSSHMLPPMAAQGLLQASKY